jgi:hypothetical protein
MFNLLKNILEVLTIWFTVETIVFLVIVLSLIVILNHIHGNFFLKTSGLHTGFLKLSQRKGLSIFVCCLYAFSICFLLFLIIPPQPVVMDEFSNLVGAYIFSTGRLAYEPHPMWSFFETFNVLQVPAYQSKFPPAMPLFMSIGIKLFNEPIFGVMLVFALGVGAFCWLLQSLVPPQWALGGALALGSHGRLIQDWGLGFWGGAASLLGGALVFGALVRLYSKSSVKHAIVLGLGILLLANHRPFEGFIFVIPALAVLVCISFWKRDQFTAPLSYWKNSLPVLFIILCLGAFAMGQYNKAVTGDYFTMPHMIYSPQYEIAGPFVFQKRELNKLSHGLMAKYAHFDQDKHAIRRQSLAGAIEAWFYKIWYYWRYFISSIFLIPLIAFFYFKHSFWDRFAFYSVAAVLVASVICTYEWPHYFAPAAAALFYMVLRGFMHMKSFTEKFKLIRLNVLQYAIVITIFLVHPPLALFAHYKNASSAFTLQKNKLESELMKSGKHLILVRYEENHLLFEEWVYNKADLENDDVLWAREKHPLESNEEILNYYRNRKIWLFEPDKDNTSLKPYTYKVVKDSLTEPK